MSFAERAQKAVQGSPQTAVVHVDGLVVLKIVKHCRDSLPQMAAGTLLGLDQGSTLEATHCFPRPAAKAEIAELNTTGEGADDPVEDEDEDGEAYQLEMMKMLREVNVDNNCVGWYKSMHLGSFCQTPLIETQFAYQETLSDNCVVLLYDPIQTAHGNLTLKARPVARQLPRLTRASPPLRARACAGLPPLGRFRHGVSREEIGSLGAGVADPRRAAREDPQPGPRQRAALRHRRAPPRLARRRLRPLRPLEQSVP